MEISAFTFRLIILLMPGLLAAVIVERLTVHPKWEQFRFGVYSLILGCASYVLLQVFWDIWRRLVSWILECGYETCTLSFWRGVFDQGVQIKPAEIFSASVVSIVLGLLISKAVQNKWMHRLAKTLRVSDKFGDENLFTYFLNTPETTWLWVRDHEKGIIYEGLKDSLSEADHVCELVMTDVKVFHGETQELLYEVPAVYLSYKPGYLTIEMANLEEKNSDSAEEDDSN